MHVLNLDNWIDTLQSINAKWGHLIKWFKLIYTQKLIKYYFKNRFLG